MGPTHTQCPDPSGAFLTYAWQPGDCDIFDGNVHPAAPEVCNDGIDNSCNPLDECWLSGPGGDGELTVPDDALTTFRTFNLATDPLQADGFGTAITTLADQNGDGIDEVVISAPHRGVSGEVFVFQSPFGAERTTTSSVKFTGLSANQRLGAAILGVPDITGDTDADLVIGEPYASTLTAGAEVHIVDGPVTTGGVIDFSGAVHLYGEPDDRLGSDLALLPSPPIGCVRSLMVASSGGDAATDGVYIVCRPVVVSEQISTRADFILRASLPGPLLAVGDQTGDGFQDVGVGYRNASTNAWEFAISDLSLAISSEADVANIAVATFTTGSDGAEDAASGDIDGDGTMDVVVGVPSSGNDDGAVYVLLGPVNQLVGDLASVAAVTIIGVSGEQLGSSVDLADVNGDGTLELLIGADGVGYVHRDPLDLPSTVASDQLETRILRASTGTSKLVPGADLDGDGYSDVLFGAPEHQTRGQVFSIRGLGL